MSRQGFTIVELLIVVVVIAILAAITIVSYNGIQDRAYNAKVVAAVDAYTKAVRLYNIQNGRFPDVGPTGVTCLGRAADFPASGDWPAGVCKMESMNNGPAEYTYAVDSLHTDLSTMVSQLPDPKIREATETYSGTYPWGGSFSGWTKYRGIYYEQTIAANNAKSWAYVEYAIKGKQTCPNEYESRYDNNVTFCSQIIR